MSHNRPLPDLNQVNQASIDSFCLRPGGHRNDPILPPSPVPVGPFPMPSPLSPKVLAPPQSPKIAPRGIADEHDIAAMPPVSTIGPTLRHMSLPPERNAPVATSPALNPDLRLVVHRNQRVVVPFSRYS
jgi:hypothetical protein